MFTFIARNYAFFHPPNPPPKRTDALRVGLFGASKIAPAAIIQPAKSHPEVIIAAVAARDPVKARAYARKHDIATVHTSYQALLDDPSIDAVYIPLPNGLHFEWALKSLQAGKHVLLEKPSTSNAIEAELLFQSDRSASFVNMAVVEYIKNAGDVHNDKSLNNREKRPKLEELTIKLNKMFNSETPSLPVLLEALHTIFHPAFGKFLGFVEPANVVEGHATLELIKGYVKEGDIRLNYNLSGGSLMDCGAYTVAAIRQIFQDEPVECVEATSQQPAGMDKRIDQAFKATWKFPNGGYGSISASMAMTGGYPLPSITGKWPRMPIPMCSAKHRQVILPDDTLSETQEHTVQKTVIFWAYILPTFWHRIDVKEHHMVLNKADKKVTKQWTKTSHVKEYGEHPSWTTYRWQLEEFVNKIRRRPGSGAWMDAEDSIKQMSMIDSGYVKAGLPLRPTSNLAK